MTTPRKVCFVTIGATAPFDALLSNVLAQPFLDTLKTHGYTTLLIQYGKEGQAIFDAFTKINSPGSPGRCDLDIKGFGFKNEGLVQEMRSTKANPSQNVVEGMILSHAGELPENKIATVFNLMLTTIQDPAPSWKLYVSVCLL